MYFKYVCKIEFWSSTNIFFTNQLASMILAPPLSIKGRHVAFQTKKVTIKESFLGFVHIHSKDAASLERVIVEKLEYVNIPLADCRSQ